MRWQKTLGALACTAILGSAYSLAAEPPAGTVEPASRADADANDAATPQKQARTHQTFRTSQLTGLNVRGADGEELGEIYDFVIDPKTGKLQYAAMSVGGILGIGDKLFAVPFSELKFDRDDSEMFFVLDVPAEKIAAAPGFDQDNWPNFADPNFVEQVDKHYRRTEVRTGETRDTAPRD